MLKRIVVVAAGLVLLAACKSGPGPECDKCAEAEANPVAAMPGAQAAGAAASGGQRASNQPELYDTARISPFTVVGRGTGDTNPSISSTETRSLAGAPSVNQGLVLPATAEASTGGGVSAAVQEERELIRDLRAQLAFAVSSGDNSTRDKLLEEIRAAMNRLSAASIPTPNVVHYHLENSKTVQTVANGAKSGDTPGTAVDAEAAKAIAEPAARAVGSVMTAPETPAVPAPAPAEGVTR